MLAIVVLHVSANGVNRLPFASNDWWLAESVNAMCRAGVPLFLMLTGALLLRRPMSALAPFYTRRFQRLAPALLGWSLFYLVWSALKAHVKQTAYSLSDALVSFAQGTPYFHLWFVFMLVGVYAAFPLLQHGWHRSTKAGRSWVLAISLFAQQLGLLLYFHWQGPSMPWPLWFMAYLPYVWLGAYLAEYPPKAQHRLAQVIPWAALVAWLLSSALVAGLRYWQQAEMGAEPFYYSHHRLSFPILLSAVALWFGLANSRWRTPTSLIASSLTLYCVHPLWLDLTSFFMSSWTFSYLWMLPVQVMLVFTGSWCCIKLMQRLQVPNVIRH